MNALNGPLKVREPIDEAFVAYFNSREGNKLAALICRAPTTVTRERGPRIERYSAPEFAEFMIDDIRGSKALLGALVAIALGGNGAEGARWLEKELGQVVQEMMRSSADSVQALADGRVTAEEKPALAVEFRALIGHLSTLVLKLEGGAT